MIARMFTAYHAVKSMIRASQFTSGASNIDISCGSTIRKHWSLFAQSFQAEAISLSVATREFSLPKFIDFLMRGGVHGTEEPDLGTQELLDTHNNYVQAENSLLIQSLHSHPD